MYSMTSFGGPPQMSYAPVGGDALSFTGDEIRSMKTALGTEVTVTLPETAGQGTATFTLLVPPIAASDEGHAEIETVGLTATQATSQAGQQYTYKVEVLAGEANFLMF